MSGEIIDVSHLLELYEQCRFLDALELVRPRWPDRQAVDQLPIETLVHCGRLAGRVGGVGIHKWLQRLARRREPAHPLVRYGDCGSHLTRRGLLEELEGFEREPALGASDPDIEASWLGYHAVLFSAFRDFTRAYALLAQAESLRPDDAYLLACWAMVELAADRRAEAIDFAERSWERCPGTPAGASVLGQALAKDGRTEEAAERIASAAEVGQGFDLAISAVWYLCAVAERLPPQRQGPLVSRALGLAERLEDLAPLAGVIARYRMAMARFDVLLLDRSPAAASRLESALPASFSAALASKLRERPGARRIVLPYEPVRQKHNTCLPASVAAVLGGQGVELDQDELASALTYAGTPGYRVVDWARERGLVAQPFLARPEVVRGLLEASVPFVLSMVSYGSAHAVAVIGLDEAGAVLIHDPSAIRLQQQLLDSLDADEAPVGPRGLVLLRGDRPGALDAIPDADRVIAEALVDFDRSYADPARQTTERVLERLADGPADDPIRQRLRAIHLLQLHEVTAAIELFEPLLAAHPDCIPLRLDLLAAVRQSQDAGRVRQLLADVVERGRLPGVTAEQVWRYPPTNIVAQYADHVGVTEPDIPRVEELLLAALRRNPYDGLALHVLGDLRLRADQRQDSLLPLRLAACLAEENEHFAREFADQLRALQREDEGLSFLEDRVDRLGALADGGDPWVTWIEANIDFGRPAAARAALEAAVDARPSDPLIHQYATRFWARRGAWSLAEAALSEVERLGTRLEYLAAAVPFFQGRGRWKDALPLCREWRDTAPSSAYARAHLLDLLAVSRGQAAALDEARSWLARQPGHDELEMLVYGRLKGLDLTGEQEELIRQRLDRDPLDAWAWRELGFIKLEQAVRVSGQAHAACCREAELALDKSVALSPTNASTHSLRGRLAEVRSDPQAAVAAYLESLEIEPDEPFCFERAWACAGRLSEDEQRLVRQVLEDCLLRTIGPPRSARDLAFSIAERYGVSEAERAVTAWSEERGDSPELIEALVDLLLHWGQGRSDAARALELAKGGLERFPYHVGLEYSLARAHAILGQADEEAAILNGILDRRPLDVSARYGVARHHERRGESILARVVLRDGVEAAPANPSAWLALAGFEQAHGRREQAIEVLTEGIERNPRELDLVERLVEILQQAGQHARAVEAARGAVSRAADKAEAWLLLAGALREDPVRVDSAEVIDCYKTALDRDASMYAAADELAVVLAERRSFEEARAFIEAQAGTLSDPSPAHARLAWLTRVAGDPVRAREEMLAVTQSWPHHAWAYARLLDWCEQDSDWDTARALLEREAECLAGDPLLQARRLTLMGKLGFAAEEVEASWEQLLADFPESEPTLLVRFDQLLERRDLDAADEILKKLEALDPTSAFILARRVEFLLLRERDFDALDIARKVWTLPGDDGWPEGFCLVGLAKAGRVLSCAKALCELAEAGARIRPAALSALEDVCRGAEVGNDPVLLPAQLERLLEALAQVETEDGRGVAAVARCLGHNDHIGSVVKFAQRRPEYCRALGPVWAAMGEIFLDGSRRGAARASEWLADWRERDGVPMWVAAVLTQAGRKRRWWWRMEEDLEAIGETAMDALSQLEQDHTAGFLACVALESQLRRGRDERFCELYAELAPIAARAGQDGNFLEPGYGFGPDILALFERLLTSDDPTIWNDLHLQFHRLVFNRRCRHAKREWRRRIQRRLPLGRRLFPGA